MATLTVEHMRIFDDDDRYRLVTILAGRTEFQEGLRARRVFLDLAGIVQLLPDFNYDGGAVTVAGDLVKRLEHLPPLPDNPDFYPLGKLLQHLLRLPDLAEGQGLFCARLIVHYRLVRTSDYVRGLCSDYALEDEPSPEAYPREVDISNRLEASRRAMSPGATKRTYHLDHDQILREYDLNLQMEEISPRLRKLPGAGLRAFALAGDHTLVANYLIPRILRYVRSQVGLSLVPQDLYLHVSDSGEIELRIEGIDKVMRPLSQPSSWSDSLLALASKERTHRLLLIWNHSLSSTQMESFARRLATENSNDLVSALQRLGCLYVFMWISLQPHDFTGTEEVCCLSRFEPLPVDLVKQWFRATLEDADVDPSDVERAVVRLAGRVQASDGVPQFVFQAIKEIIDDLNKGRL